MPSLVEDLATRASGKTGSLSDKSIRDTAPAAICYFGATVKSDANALWKVTRRCDKTMAAQLPGTRFSY
jgi:hypothetical protein